MKLPWANISSEPVDVQARPSTAPFKTEQERRRFQLEQKRSDLVFELLTALDENGEAKL